MSTPRAWVRTYGRRTQGLEEHADLVQFSRANVGAIGESKVDETPFAQEIFFREGFALVRREREWTANVGSSDGTRFALLLCSGVHVKYIGAMPGVHMTTDLFSPVASASRTGSNNTDRHR